MAMITLRKALVKKNQLKGRIKELKALVEKKNSYRADTSSSSFVDTRPAMLDLEDTTNKLIALKTAISCANTGIYYTLAQLEEAKAKVDWLSDIDTFEGTRPASVFGGGGDNPPVAFVAQLKEDELRDERAALQKLIELLLEQVDEFNSTTKIEVGFLD